MSCGSTGVTGVRPPDVRGGAPATSLPALAVSGGSEVALAAVGPAGDTIESWRNKGLRNE
jgi:hypothetical protein